MDGCPGQRGSGSQKLGFCIKLKLIRREERATASGSWVWKREDGRGRGAEKRVESGGEERERGSEEVGGEGRR